MKQLLGSTNIKNIAHNFNRINEKKTKKKHIVEAICSRKIEKYKYREEEEEEEEHLQHAVNRKRNTYYVHQFYWNALKNVNMKTLIVNDSEKLNGFTKRNE